MPPSLNELAYRWATVQAGERANAQQYLIELCEALGVERPRGRGTGYEFEHEVKVLSRDGVQSSNFIDLYKAHHFVLEAKDSAHGTNTETLLRKAFGQVRGYVGFLREERPPYVMVMDVAKTLIVWDRWAGDYGGFNADALGKFVAPRGTTGTRRRALWTTAGLGGSLRCAQGRLSLARLRQARSE